MYESITTASRISFCDHWSEVLNTAGYGHNLVNHVFTISCIVITMIISASLQSKLGVQNERGDMLGSIKILLTYNMLFLGLNEQLDFSELCHNSEKSSCSLMIWY